MKETEKKGFIIEFGDLSISLKTFVVLGWITIIITLISFVIGFISGLRAI